MLISIIITVKNEANSIPHLLDSLLVQEKPFEIIIVDANSDDGTQDIVKTRQKKYPEVKLFIKEGSRGEGRNFGAKKAQGEVIAFTDGGCTADKNWLSELRKKIIEGYDIVAGKTIDTGTFTEIKRVELEIDGYDITWPSCNLAYRKQIFEKIGGFDEQFITAEDVDLNLMAVTAGAKLVYSEKAIIYRDSAQTIKKYLKQSFWYGFGRKQLTLKHGKLWKSYSPQQMFNTQLTIQGLTRLFFGLLGYLVCKMNNGK